ncbi:NAD-dependent epimerase/dehydratase family protein [Lysobacter sp. H21R4]|uniref:NAD-dependent epimerase/dehydratase family protein n=1 Tax=Lysobacter sp. H21R4 TaxID=2781021 RepID=UPI001889897C|nr:NAD-dependent epimerase/dehydratase family protein [Lysobacter sp. H21R4]QOY62385.1 NAD-dependent epimerase/dehydratase family protein [Lysobacter sp. H21R4]
MASPSDLAGKRVLVTGSSGFTGRYVMQAFAEQGAIVVPFGTGDGRSVDLLNRGRVQSAVAAAQADIVVHLAAISFVAHGDAEEIYRVNIVGTRNLLEALAQQDLRPAHVVLASSANVYGNTEGMLEESLPAAPVNDYAVSKYAMELMARQFANSLPLTIVRPFNYTGVGQVDRFLIPKIVGHFKRREPRLELGNLEVSRDFNDVRNVAGCYIRLATLPGQGEVFNVCSGIENTLMDVVEMMHEISGYHPEIVVNPAFVRTNEVRTLVGNPGKLRSAIGPVEQWTLRETLRWMYEKA